MPQLKDIITYLLVIAGFLILYLFFNNKPENQSPKVIYVRDTTTHTINTSKIENPVTIKQGEINIPPSVIQVLQSTDTAALRMFCKELSARFYETREQQVVSEDDSLKITATNTVTENRITATKVKYQIKFPIAHLKKRNKLFMGVNLGNGNGKIINNIGPELTFVEKHGWMYKVNWNSLEAIRGNPYEFQTSVSWLLSFRKKENR